MRDYLLQRLASLGYTAQDSDGWLLDFCIQKVKNTIQNKCNITDIPNNLWQIAVDMAAGEFLLVKKSSGQLDGFTIDLNDTPFSEVREGDTTVKYSIGHDGALTPEQRLDALIKRLLEYGKEEFYKYRRFAW
jgi:hypothetical protein